MAERFARTGGLLTYFARHRTAANLLLVCLLAVGIAAAPRMRAQFFPDVVIDDVTVSVAWDGAGAEDVDRGIVQVLEPALLVVEGVEEASSRASEGRATIELEFEPGWDMQRAAADVEAAVEAARNLPEAAEDPEVRRGAWRDRVTDVVITGPVGIDQLGRFADEFVARLFAIGVTRTTISGFAAPQTLVEVPSLTLLRYDLTMSEIAEAIGEEARADPAGDVSGSGRVRTGTAKRSAADIAAIVLRSETDGSALTVGDVATVTQLGSDRQTAFFVGENPAVTIRVDRSDQGDAIEIQRQVEDVAAEMRGVLPQGVAVDLIRTRAEAITGRLEILLENGAMGLGLVVALLFLFLNARTALWVATGIPVSMLTAIALMYAFGLTLNMISLFALILTLGIVVDDAIVVGEHADFRVRRLRETGAVAAETAARRMFAPVLSATLTTIIAFFGLVAIDGRFGDLIADIPFTVIAVLTASLVECFLILPNHLSHALSAERHWYDWPSRQVNRGFGWVRDRLFRPVMRLVIVARYPVLGAALLLLASQIALFIRGDVPWRFFNSPEQPSISGNFAMLPGAAREDTLEMMRNVQEAVDALGAKYEAEYGLNPVAYMIAQIGGTSGRGLASADDKDEDQLGAVSIELIEADLRPYSSFAFVAELQEAVPQHPLLEELSFRGWRSGPGGDALDVELSGADTAVLKDAAEALKAAASEFPEVSALEDSLAYDKDELILELTPQGQALGFTIDAVGRVLRDRLSGIEAASFPDGSRSATIRVELPEAELTADFLDRTQMRAPSGAYVPLGDIVTVARETGFASIRRENGVRVVSVTGDVSDDDPARAAAIQEALETEILPRLEEEYGVATRMAGLAEQEGQFLTDALAGLTFCLLGIYLILTWIFASWTRPLVVMAVIPFGLVGALWGHYIWEVPLSMFSVVGLIGMVGIIINDSIVLVTTVDEYAADRGLAPAIIDGTADRLRPVFLTTATTVMGLAPLLYEGSADAQFLKPTVITLVYGLGFGMVLVLLVVPAVLAMQGDVAKAARAMRRALGRRRARRSAPAAAAAGGMLLAAAGLLALTLVPVIFGEGMPARIAARLPEAVPPLGAALLLYVAGVCLAGLAIWLVAAALRLIRGSRGIRSRGRPRAA